MKTKYFRVGFTTCAVLIASFSIQAIASAQSGSVNIEGTVSEIAGEVSDAAGNLAGGSENIGSLSGNTFFDNQGSTTDFSIAQPEDSMGRIDSIYGSTPVEYSHVDSPASFSNQGEASYLTPRTLTILGGPELTTETADSGPFFEVANEDFARWGISFALGRRHRNWLRTETEVAFRSHNDSTLFQTTPLSDVQATFGLNTDINAVSLMRNAILEWNNTTRFTPYGGAGIGVSYVDFEQSFFDDATPPFVFNGNDTVFTWQAIAGVATEVTGNLDFLVEYRYFAATDVTVDFLEFGDFIAQNLFFGARFHF